MAEPPTGSGAWWKVRRSRRGFWRTARAGGELDRCGQLGCRTEMCGFAACSGMGLFDGGLAVVGAALFDEIA